MAVPAQTHSHTAEDLRTQADAHAAAADRYARFGATVLADRHERYADEKYTAAEQLEQCAVTTAPHCGWHHRPADQCPPLDPELGDLIPDLAGRGINIQLIPAGLFPERCEDCIAVDGPVLDAVAVVCHRAPSEPLPEGYTYRAHVCGVHLRSNVTWELRRGCQTWVELPVDFGGAA